MKKESRYTRKRIDTPDGDFLDLDFSKIGSSRLCILNHGLEGSSGSPYIISAAANFNDAGYDVLAWNYRGCSGENNRSLTMYHSGYTTDLDFVIRQIKNEYSEIVLTGFSLGGNMILKYGGEKGNEIDNKIKAIIGISVPCDLSACSLSFSRWENFLYEKSFLYKLVRKIKSKSQQFPDIVDPRSLPKIRTIMDFDEYYTAPLNGFKNAEDYYQKSSCLHFLELIRVPALIINALDDPFLHGNCFPYDIASSSDLVHLLDPPFGGHVGFGGFSDKMRWSDKRAVEFAKNTGKYPA